ncbi:hypothetical protein E5Q11_08080 [Marinobacter confluentis]|uniref:Fibronectin type III domain-containing protein n=3 Tax=Marinobacter confluentis TaxID=1697557 RepID=A0A4Z1C268_9GAMM|nr:hypothetical protein E5Q11_08080 [Marinobacter confluentis]
MQYRGNILSRQGLLVIFMVVLLSGCDLDIPFAESSTTTRTENTSEPTAQIAGAAMKGVIQQGLVVANRLIADKNGHYTPQRQAAKPVRTAEDGSYEWQLRGKADGWALVELQADNATRMICDVAPQCDQADASSIAFGQPMSVDSSFSLRGAGDLTTEIVNLTPLTHLAVALAERNANGLSPDSLSSAYATVENWFDLPAGALRLSPPDLTKLDQMTSVTADAIQVAIANAAFLALVNDQAQWNSISEVLANLSSQVSTTGEISLMGDGTNIALTDLISAAALQASELQATVSSSVISQKLVIVEYRNVQHFKTIADTYADSDADSDTNVTDTEAPTGTTDSDPTTDDSGTSTDEPAVDTNDETLADTDTGTGSGTDTTPESTIPANAALLSWTAPLTRENGESLAMSEIAGFEVVYGTSAEALDQSLAIGDAYVDELLIDELAAGTWYFAIRTLDMDGRRSQLSNVVHKQI